MTDFPTAGPAGQRLYSAAEQDFGTAGSPYGARTAVTVAASTSETLPAGWLLCECDSHTSIRTTYDGGSNWITPVAASGTGYVWSDGITTEVRGDGTGGTAHYSIALAAA